MTTADHPQSFVESEPQSSSISLENLASRRSKNWSTTGYLGYTSYSTVIEETLSILNSQPETENPCTPSTGGQVTISRHLLQLGVAVLSHIPDVEHGFSLLREPKPKDAWIYIIARRFLNTLYHEYGNVLGKNRDLAKLEEMARRLCLNTAKTLCDDAAGPDKWLAYFEGPNLRWESLGSPSHTTESLRNALTFILLGLLFNFWSLQADPACVEHSMSQVRPLAEYYFPVAHECLIRCIDLSQEFSQGNVFLLFLHYRQTNLESLVSGEAGESPNVPCGGKPSAESEPKLWLTCPTI
jgi:hypothetical protein